MNGRIEVSDTSFIRYHIGKDGFLVLTSDVLKAGVVWWDRRRIDINFRPLGMVDLIVFTFEVMETLDGHQDKFKDWANQIIEGLEKDERSGVAGTNE